MRRRKTDLRTRVNGDLQLDFADVALTSYAGLELFGRYLRATGFNGRVRDAFAGAARWGDFGVVAMVRLVIGLLVVGGRRVEHVRYVADDPVVRRFCGLQTVPGARTLGRWLRVFTMATVGRLQALNLAVVAPVLATLGLRTLTIDVDGVVVSTGLQVARAFRGFNPHHRKVPSYYPIMAHLAETTHVLRFASASRMHEGREWLAKLAKPGYTSAGGCMKVNMLEAKNQLSRLVREALDGEEVVIARNGEPMVRLVPVGRKSRLRGWGTLRKFRDGVDAAFTRQVDAEVADSLDTEP